MGSGFFQPWKGTGFGSGSTLGKIGRATQPVSKYLRYVSPGASVAYNQGERYNKEMNVPFGPTPYAGVTPTLADANRGYVLASQKVGQPQAPSSTPKSTLPWMGS